LNKEDHTLIKSINKTLSKIVEIFGDKIKIIKNRAISVSVFLFCYELLESNLERDIVKFVRFLELFLRTLKWQIKKGVLMDSQYYDLLKFQTNITQAAAEKTAIEKRHDFLHEYFEFYKNGEEIKGDSNYKKSKGDPNKERKNIKL
jgi:flagellar biosynthesis GTPase FlhF